MGAAAGNIIATIITTLMVRNRGARRPMVGEAIAIPVPARLPGQISDAYAAATKNQEQDQDDIALNRNRIAQSPVHPVPPVGRSALNSTN